MKKRKGKSAEKVLAFALTFATVLSMMPEYVASKCLITRRSANG